VIVFETSEEGERKFYCSRQTSPLSSLFFYLLLA